MASVRRRVEASTGKIFYQSTWSVYDANGKRHRKTKVFDRLGDAKAYASRMELEYERRGIGDVENLKFADFKDRVLAHWKTTRVEPDGRTRKGMEITTYCNYRRNLDTLAKEIGAIRISKLTAWHLDRAFARLRVSGGVSRKAPAEGKQRGTRPLGERSLLHIYRVGKTAMKQAVRWKMIDRNPFDDVDAPSPEDRKIVIMTEAEAIRIYQAAVKAHESGKHPGYDLLVALLMTCGLRRSEVLGLGFDCIDERGVMRIFRTVVRGDGETVLRLRTKTRTSTRSMTIPTELLPMIARHRQWVNEMMLKWGRESYRKDPLLLFPGFGGEPLGPEKLTTRLRQFQRQAKVTGVMPTHGFRHGMASQLVAGNVNIRQVADRMGHSTTWFTMQRYAHPVEGGDEAAAAALGGQLQTIMRKAEVPS